MDEAEKLVLVQKRMSDPTLFLHATGENCDALEFAEACKKIMALIIAEFRHLFDETDIDQIQSWESYMQNGPAPDKEFHRDSDEMFCVSLSQHSYGSKVVIYPHNNRLGRDDQKIRDIIVNVKRLLEGIPHIEIVQIPFRN
jgi:hypothetical protein